MSAFLHGELTKAILGACFEVSNELGAGFLESVYQNALLIVLREKGLKVQPQFPLSVEFRAYQRQVVNNAKRLAAELAEAAIEVGERSPGASVGGRRPTTR